MKKIVTVIGARPQIIKSAALSRAIQAGFSDKLQEVLVHTGQHYSNSLSDVFFEELEIAKPSYNLQVGSGKQGAQTAEMIKKLEEVFEQEKPNAAVVYGDTNSTLAAAIVTSKMEIPLVHIEAGMRSFNKSMPEEVNRIMCDHVSTLLFSPTKSGIENLKNEGFKTENVPPFCKDNPGIYFCGDIMLDNHLFFSEKIKTQLPLYELLSLQAESYFLGTVHRAENVENKEKMKGIFEAFIALTENYPQHSIYLPLHPRTRQKMSVQLGEELMKKIEENPKIKIIPPVSYLKMLALQKHCDLVITDSGGLQKEAYFSQKPTVVLRNETEWVEIVAQGNALTVGTEKLAVLKGVETMMTALQQNNLTFPPLYGDGKAAVFIAQEIVNHCGKC